ncbi:MAG TPA: hypothetical protein VGM98_01730 [Schlesneria sp.]|jgi:hypothetical protein
MREFFRGWRRKAGCVTLVVAMALTGIWITSRNRVWGHRWYTKHSLLSILVREWGFDCQIWDMPDPELFNRDTIAVGWAHTIDSTPTRFEPFRRTGMLEPEWHRHWAGFHWGQVTFLDAYPEHVTINKLIVPHWATALPLTLLSAYLILWKPRKRE